MVEDGSSSGRAAACFHHDFSPLELMSQPLCCLPVPQERAEHLSCWRHQGKREGEGMDPPHIASQTDVASLQHHHLNRTALQSVPYLSKIE